MTLAYTRINNDYRHGDDARALRWLQKRGYKFTAITLRYFRKQPHAYSPELRALFTKAYRKIQLSRKHGSNQNQPSATGTARRNQKPAYIYRRDCGTANRQQ